MTLGLLSALLGFATPILTWLMRKAGVDEKKIEIYLAAVSQIQDDRTLATKISDDEEEALKRLKERNQNGSKP